MKVFKVLLTPSIIILVGVLGYWGGWWDDLINRKPAAPASLRPGPIKPGLVILKTKLTGWDQEKKSWEIEARRIWQSADGFQIYFECVNKGIIFSVEDKRVDFKAGWVRWEKLRNRLYIGGGLEARIEDGVFNTREAVMEYQEQELVCTMPVRYREPNLVISGERMRVELNKDQLVLEGKTELVQNKDRVRANGLVFYLKDEKYQLLDPGSITLNP